MTNLAQTEFLDENQVADLLNISVATLRRWRWVKKGPNYVKMGRSVRYRHSDILLFISSGFVEVM